MLDGIIRKGIDPVLNRISRRLADRGVSANAVTLAGAALGLLAGVLIAAHVFVSAAVVILLSRLCDGLDGGVAKIRGKTDFGGILDIVMDMVFYGAIPVGFAFADPANNAIPTVVLLFIFYLNAASFLSYAIMAEKRAMTSTVRGEKSLHYTTGLVEASETIVVYVAACLLPDWYAVLAWIFSVALGLTALGRVLQARRMF